MNGPEHYKQAEQILAEMNAMISDPNDDDIAALGDAARHTFMMAAIGQAQAHATLALAAAMGTFGSVEQGGPFRAQTDDQEWQRTVRPQVVSDAR